MKITGAAQRMALSGVLVLGMLTLTGGPTAGQGTFGGTTSEKQPPGAVIAETTEIKAKVDAVDLAKRQVTLTGPRGNTVTVKVGPEVKNLDQVKPGDSLVVRYLESVAVFVRKSGEAPAAGQVGAVKVAPKGQKPAAVMVDTVELTATVEAIDYASRRVTLKGPEGKTRTIRVDPTVKRLQEVKKGDTVVARYTEAVAVFVK